MRKINEIFTVFVALVLLSSQALATQCEATNLKVVNVFQYDDGSIFLDFDKPIGCGCLFDSRAAFHKDDNQKFLMGLTLVVISTGKTVNIRADNVGMTCPIHGNTARLTSLSVKSN